MKDTAHHLKHVQKKVIQSARKAQAAEEPSQKQENAAPVINTEVSPVYKKKQFNSQLRKSLMRLHVH